MHSVLDINRDGRRRWLTPDGHLHRIGGPAISWPSGEYRWFHHGNIHRIDGPAEYVPYFGDYPHIDEYNWCLDNKRMPFVEWLIANNQITDQAKVMLKLKYG
jgi:hypothetical protein